LFLPAKVAYPAALGDLLASALALDAIRRWRAEGATLGPSCGYIKSVST
jgi:predicted GNAT family acetyltransferase